MTTAFVCTKCDGGRRLLAHLAERTDVTCRAVGCQKICSHDVVGVRRAGGITWLKKVDSKPRRKALRRFVASAGDADVPPPLRRLVVRKRADRVRT
jgi:hypothetical protein